MKKINDVVLAKRESTSEQLRNEKINFKTYWEKGQRHNRIMIRAVLFFVIVGVIVGLLI